MRLQIRRRRSLRFHDGEPALPQDAGAARVHTLELEGFLVQLSFRPDAEGALAQPALGHSLKLQRRVRQQRTSGEPSGEVARHGVLATLVRSIEGGELPAFAEDVQPDSGPTE